MARNHGVLENMKIVAHHVRVNRGAPHYAECYACFGTGYWCGVECQECANTGRSEIPLPDVIDKIRMGNKPT